MKRLNFTLDDQTVALLEELSGTYFDGNKSHTVRIALENLKHHKGNRGWVITGYTPVRIDEQMACSSCGEPPSPGEVLYRPVFEKGDGAKALKELPSNSWAKCSSCVESH